MRTGFDKHGLMTATTCVFAVMLSCTLGGSAEQGNARISGSISGGPGSDSCIGVQLVRQGYDPYRRDADSVISTRTIALGHYEFSGVPAGTYYLYAFDADRGYTHLDGPHVVTDGDDLKEMNAVLLKASTVIVTEPDPEAAVRARYYIAGATDTVRTDPLNQVKLTGVPAGVRDVMRHDAASDLSSLFTRDLEVLPGDSISISQHNRPPRVITPAVLPAVVYVDSAYSLFIRASDPDSDVVRYTPAGPAGSCRIDSVSGAIVWTPQRSEATLTDIRIRAADPYGAYSIFSWKFTVTNNGPAPAPAAPAGPSDGRADSTVFFKAEASACVSASPLFRFSWGDGDTTAFSSVLPVQHSWELPGAYEVRVQVGCPDYAKPSDWSPPLAVTIGENRTTPAPEFVYADDTVYGYDTGYTDPKYGATISDTIFDRILISVEPCSCASAPLYRFYCDGLAITDWTTETSAVWIPGAMGTFEFRVAVWCDTVSTAPSALSAPHIVTVAPGIRPPVISGDNSYSPTSPGYLKLTIQSGSPTTAGTPVYYRLSVGFKEIGDSVPPVRIGSMIIDTCTDEAICQDTIPAYNFTPTVWFAGSSIQLILTNGSGNCMVQGQAKTAGKALSGLTGFEISPR